MDLSSSKFEIIHSIVCSPDNVISVTDLCKTAGVSRSGYYNWLASENTRRKKEDADLHDFSIIKAAFEYRGYSKGAKGIHMRLLHQKPPVVMNIKKIRRLMKKYNLFCEIRKANP